MTLIPESQNRPPAGFGDYLAFLPSCDDVQTRTVQGIAEFYVTRADDSVIVLYSGSPNQFWQTWLGSAGLCKVQGESVPIVEPGSLLAIQHRPTINNIPQTASLPYGLIGIVLMSLALIGIALYQNRPDAAESAFINGGDS